MINEWKVKDLFRIHFICHNPKKTHSLNFWNVFKLHSRFFSPLILYVFYDGLRKILNAFGAFTFLWAHLVTISWIWFHWLFSYLYFFVISIIEHPILKFCMISHIREGSRSFNNRNFSVFQRDTGTTALNFYSSKVSTWFYI